MNNFIDDVDKIEDMILMSKDRFLSSYRYLTVAEYENTKNIILHFIKTKKELNKKLNVNLEENKMEKIKKFEKIINEIDIDMTKMYILYNMSCHDNYENLSDTQKDKLIDFIYDIFMDDETNTYTGIWSDLVMDNYKKVLNGKMDDYDIRMLL